MQGSGIYQIINMVSGKRYIGSAVNPRKRWVNHRSDLRRGKHPNIHLQRAWSLYGGKAFAFLALEYVPDLERLVEREQHYFDALQPEYNIAPVAGSTLGCKLTEETKQKVRKALTGRPVSEETRRKISEALKGKVFSEEVRRNMGEAQRGKVFSAEHRENIARARRKLTDQDVLEIQALLEEAALTQREIAARYGVHNTSISLIKRGRSHGHGA